MPKKIVRRRTGRARAATAADKRIQLLARQVDQNRRDLDLQFRRIAQIQAELDSLKNAWQRKVTGD